MNSLYRSPLRVYLILAALSLIGIWSAFQLPVSLFPNSSKPTVRMCIGYSISPDAFLRQNGSYIESQLKAINTELVQEELVKSTYESNRVCYHVRFKWGTPNREAYREVQAVSAAVSARLPQDSRDQTSVNSFNEAGGFYALGFYSPKRSLTEMYNLLDPMITPALAKIQDAEFAILWNPQQQQVQVELKPEAMASFGLFPNDIANAILRGMESYGAGSLTTETGSQQIIFKSALAGIEDVSRLTVKLPAGGSAPLGALAHIDLAVPTDQARIFKTTGAATIMVFAQPKADGNVKRMAEDITASIKEVMKNVPSDIQYKSLVDPSDFIRSAVENVMHEVLIAAFLAVVILFLFVGNLKNVITAAIEIPLSMILAFILMRISGMNLNLISLGGLALSAGMNVDASVVVMENIFRHFDMLKGPVDFEKRLATVVQAVREVRFSVIASTIASLVVFLPLAFTSDLTYAILGDLAKAVVFSHGFSAIVALILVPTIRLQMLSKGSLHEKPALMEGFLVKLENLYGNWLEKFIESPMWKTGLCIGLVLLLALLLGFVLPRLPKEIIGKPETDWVYMELNTSGNTSSLQMESLTESAESQVTQAIGDKISYTFTQINGANSASILARLKNKKDMNSVAKILQAKFPSTPTVYYNVDSWNPAELPLPNPPNMQVSVRGTDVRAMQLAAREIRTALEEQHIWPQIESEPSSKYTESIAITPKLEQWSMLPDLRFTASDLADMVRVAVGSQRITNINFAGKSYDIFMRYPSNEVGTAEAVGALPVSAAQKIVALKSLADVKQSEAAPTIYREDGREVFYINGSVGMGEKGDIPEALKKSRKVLDDWLAKHPSGTSATSGSSAEFSSVPVVGLENSDKELDEALKQLLFATSLSIGLIFITMVIQFGDIMNALLVLVAIPLGFIGVLLSLYIFHSTLSLNSLLGVILLNGISVANSIILVDFLGQAVRAGEVPRLAAVKVARIRLRPILMTSLTTALGMVPVAFGFGEGGKILQPLGIAVVGGLGFSLALTLFVVPALQVAYLEYKNRKALPQNVIKRSAIVSILIGLLSVALASSSVQAETAPMRFGEAYETLMKRSGRIRAQELQIESTSTQRLKARGLFLPTLSAVGSGQNTHAPDSENRQVYLSTQMNLFKFGADWENLRAANLDRESQMHALGRETLLAEDEGLQAIFEVIRRTQQRETLSRARAANEELYNIAQERFSRGFLPRQEADKVQVDLNIAKNAEADGIESERVARATLTSLLGTDNVMVEWPWQTTLKPDLEILKEKLNLESRPDRRFLESQTQAESHRTRSTFRALLPSVDLTASYGNFDTLHTTQVGSSLMLTLTLPIFDQFKEYADYQNQAVNEAQARLKLELLDRSIPSEVESTRSNLITAVNSALSRESTRLASQRLLHDNLDRFRGGRASANDVAVDQARLSTAEQNAVDGWNQAHLALVKYCHALGKPARGVKCVQ